MTVDVHPASFCANNGIALKQAAVQGLGVILVPHEFVSNELADGTLVKLIPNWQPDPHALFAVYPSTRSSPPTCGSLSSLSSRRFNCGEPDRRELGVCASGHDTCMQRVGSISEA